MVAVGGASGAERRASQTVSGSPRTGTPMTLAILFLSLALQNVSPEVAQHMQAGVEAHKQGRLEEAISEFRKATEAGPNLAEGFLDLGEVYAEMHNYKAAIPALRRALELSPDLDAAHLQLGYALLSQGYAADAIPHLERVHAVEALGVAQIATGQYQEAIANLGAALAKRPGNPDLLYYLGRASGLLSKSSIDALLSAYPDSARAHEAKQELERADSLKSDMPETLYSLGKAASQDGDAALAEKAWMRVIALEKETSLAAQAHFGLAGLYRKEGKTVQAEHEMREFEKLQKLIAPPPAPN